MSKYLKKNHEKIQPPPKKKKIQKWWKICKILKKISKKKFLLLFPSFLFLSKKMLSSWFINIRRTRFDQSSPVQPISDFRGGGVPWAWHRSSSSSRRSSRTVLPFSNIGCNKISSLVHLLICMSQPRPLGHWRSDGLLGAATKVTGGIGLARQFGLSSGFTDKRVWASLTGSVAGTAWLDDQCEAGWLGYSRGQ